ncbi:hypothetical protein [Serratia microhaemolytica]|uniref:hypothetical protein n=1 Tax=Serratia microhaemolytica TaxID=2675110 RepID=UPI000FDEF3AA|nr:hypothetical protein [Serratia microhaemolytica]
MAFWVGEPPVVGGNYDTEVDINDTFEFDRNIAISNETSSSINFRDEVVTLVAEVICYEEDGILTVSLGGCIIFLEASLDSAIDGYVTFFTSVDKFFFYPA